MDHPGKVLKERFLDPLGITPYRLAKGIGVQQTRISQVVAGKRAITSDTAIRLGAFFGVPARWFMDIQTRYDLARTASSADGIEKLEGRYWVRPSGAAWMVAARPAQPTTYRVDAAFRKQIADQAKLGPGRKRRTVAAVEYENGMKAIVGR